MSQSKKEFSKLKLAMSLDYIFGRGTSKKKAINYDELEYHFSRKTGRLRYVLDPKTKKVLFSFRANGSIAPTIEGAKLLLGSSEIKTRANKRPRFVVTVLDGITELASQGKTIFCKHVVACHPSLRAGEDVLILNEHGNLLAVGRSMLSSSAMKQFKRGSAVKVREGISSRNGSGTSII